MDSIDWDLAIKAALAVIAIAGFYIGWCGGRRKEKREIAAEQRAELASRRTAVALLWKPTETEIERIVRETQDYQRRHPSRQTETPLDMRQVVTDLFDMLESAARYVQRHFHGRVEVERANGEWAGEAAHKQAMTDDFPTVLGALLRGADVVARLERNTLRELELAEDKSQRNELRKLAEGHKALKGIIPALETALFDIAGTPPDERANERSRALRTLKRS